MGDKLQTGRQSRVDRLLTICLGFALLVTAGAPLLAAETQGAGRKPERSSTNDYNLIFISLTNTRADHLGIYGYQRNTSPHIDRFAQKCLVFRNVFSHASWTLPVVLSLFTSQYPFTHGLMNREEAQPLPEPVTTFVDVLKAKGYFTAAFVGDRDYSPKFGLTSRFHLVFDPVKNPDLEDWKGYGVLENTMPAARDWLRRNKDKKFFLLVQGYDTHCPFATPRENRRFARDYRGKIDFTKCYWTFERTRPVKMRSETGLYQEVYLLKTKPTEGDNYEVMFYPEDVNQMVALYDGEIYNADQLIGGLFDDISSLGLERKTLVVFYSDHGDMFGKHGRFMRGGPLRGTFYDDVLRIPLLIYHPDVPAKTVTGLGQVIDIAPTLLDLMGLKSPSSFRGKSLMPAVTNQMPVNDCVFAGSAFTPSEKNPFFQYNSTIVSARNEKWKLIVERVSLVPGPQDTFELYHLAEDPDELRNVADKNPEALKAMKAAINTWSQEIKAEKSVPNL